MHMCNKNGKKHINKNLLMVLFDGKIHATIYAIIFYHWFITGVVTKTLFFQYFTMLLLIHDTPVM